MGNLSLGLSVATSPLDLLEARLAALERNAYVARVNVDTSAVTQAEAQLASLQGAQQAMGSTATKIAVDAADVDKASISIANVRAGLAGMKGDALGAASGFEAFGPAAIAVAVVAAGMAVATVEAGKFQQQMANLQAVLHATPNDLGALGTNIQDSSKATIFTMAGVAEADRQLAKAGQDATQIMREQMDVLNLSSATQVSAAEGATAFVTSLKNFNLTATDSTMIADTLARSVDSSVGTLADMTQALQQVGPVAQNAGLDLKTTTAAIADLENAGLQGDAGSALKIFLTRLESPTTAAKAAMKDLGLQVYDTNGQLLALSAIFDQIQQKTRGLDDETKNMDLTAIFGARGVRVADIASAQGSSGLQDVIDHETQIGGAAEIAATKLDTLQGQVKILVSSLSVLATNIGEGLLPKMTELAKAGTDITNVFANLTANVGGKQQQNSAFKDVFTAVGLDDPNAYQDQLAKIQTLKDKVADAQKQLDSFHGVRIPGISATNMSQDQLKADIVGWNQAIDQEQALVDKAKKLQTDSPTTATNALNANIATIINDQTSRDARSAGAPDDLVQIAQHAQDAKNYVDSFQASFISSGHTIQEWKQIEGDAFADIDKHAKQTSDALEQASVDETQRVRDLQDQRAKLLDEGAPEALINRGLFGDDLGLTKQQIADASKALKDWETQYNADQTAQRQNAAAQLAADKQRIADEASADKAAASQKAADQTAAAQAVEQAWSQAASAINGLDKTIDGTAAISSLAGIDEQLHTTEASLAALGQDSPHLDALTSLADIFKGITDQTDKASAALNAYNVTLSNTNKAIQEIGSLRSEYLAALDAAEKRQAAGTASASDLAIINARTSILSTLGQQTTQLQQAANTDILGKLANLPDYAGLDAQARATLAANGGTQKILLDITTNADAAQQDIKDKLLQAKQTQIDIKTNAADVQTQIDNIAKARTASLTIVTSFVDTNGVPVPPPTLDPTRGYGDSPVTPPTATGGSGYSVGSGFGAGGAMPGGLQGNTDLVAAIKAATNDPVQQQAMLMGALLETSGRNVPQQGGGPGRGYFQIEAGPGGSHPDVSEAQAMDPMFAAKYMAPAYAKAVGAYNPADPMNSLALVAQRAEGPANPYPASRVSAAWATAQQYLTPGSGTSGTQPTESVANDVGQQIVAKALQSVDTDHLANYCEQFVEETVQSITGQRGATGRREASASSALTDAQSMGLVTKTPEPGDLVYYGGTPGNPAGHVAIYMGNGQQVSTADRSETGKEGLVHTEAVGPGAVYVSTGGNVGTEHQQGGQAYSNLAVPGTPPPNINDTTGGLAQATVSANDLSAAMAKVNAEFAKMDKASVAGTKSELQSVLPILTQMQEEAAKTQLGTDTLDTLSKQQADAAAWQQGLQYESDFAQIVQQMEAHTISLDEATQKLAADVGGPLAQAYGQAGAAAAQITAANSQIAAIGETQKAEDAAHQAALQQIQQAGQAQQQAMQAAQQAMQAAQQAAANRIQDEQTAENSRYTQVQRAEQDQQRQLQFSQQVQATDLQNKLTDTQKQQQSTIYQRTAQEQVVAASAQGASTNAGEAGQAAILAAMHNQDLAQKDLNTKAIDDIQLQIREQAKAANLESYNLETETIKQQRKHEDIMTGLAAESTAQQRAAQQQQAQMQAASQAAQQQIQDETQAENTKYQNEKDANQAAIDALNKQKDVAQASLDAANQAIAAWQQTGLVISQAASSAANLPSYINSTAPLTGVNAIRNLGGYAAGGNITSPLALVGEYGPEIIHAPGYGVIPAAKTAQLLSSASGGGGTTVTFGDINVVAGDGDAWMAEARAQFEARLQQVKHELERKGLTAKNRSGIRT